MAEGRPEANSLAEAANLRKRDNSVIARAAAATAKTRSP